MLPAIAGALSLLLAATDVRLELDVRSEVRASRLAPRSRTDLPAPDPEDRYSAELRPNLGLVAEGRGARLRLGYLPRVWVSDVGHSDQKIDHAVDLTGDLRPSASLRLGLAASGVRGEIDPLADPWSDFATTPVPAGEPQHYQNARAAVNVGLRLTARAQLSSTTSASTSGGTDARSRASLPTQHTFAQMLSLQRSVTPRDQLGIGLDGSLARTFPEVGPSSKSGFAQVAGRWDHHFTPALQGWAAAGATYVDERGGQREDPLQGYAPGGELGLSHLSRTGFLSRMSVRFAPEIDRLTGEVRRSVQGAATLQWQSGPDWAVGIGANSSAAVPDREPFSFGGEVRVVRRITGGLSAEVGLRSRLQRDRRTPQGTFEEYGAYLAVDWTVIRPRALPPP